MIYINYMIGAGIMAAVLLLINIWLREYAWPPKVLAWMTILWPLTAVALTSIFMVVGTVRLVTFIHEKPKSNIGARTRQLFESVGDAVFEPIINKVVKKP